MDSPSPLWNQILIIIILILLNAFYASNEVAYVSLNQSKIRALADDGNRSAKRVLQMITLPESFLTMMQVIRTLMTIVISMILISNCVGLLELSLANTNAGQMALLIALVIIIAFLIILLGELFPKQIALQMPENVALASSWFMYATYKLFSPFVWLLNKANELLKKVVPMDFNKRDERFTRDEMKAILSESRDEGSIDLEEFTMLQGVLSLDDRIAREIMVPRTDTFMIDIGDDNVEILDEILGSPYSRIPVYFDEKDNVIGVLHVKHLFKEVVAKGIENIDIRSIMSSPVFVPSTIYVDDLLVEFRRVETHMAILLDEYGGVEGIVTMEDVLEEIVGNIEDETDEFNNSDIQPIDETHYMINGILPLDKFNNYFNEKLVSEEVDTIAGLMIYQMGYVPTDDERITFRANRYVLTTALIENGRIRLIEVELDEYADIDTDYNLYIDIDDVHDDEDDEGMDEREYRQESDSTGSGNYRKDD